jgi:hypothetical protein
VYVTGDSLGSPGSQTINDYATVKYDAANGNLVWVARYNYASYDRAKALAVDGNGNVYVTGESQGTGTYYDYATIKYNSSGVQQWAARYTGLGGNASDAATAIAVDSAGNVYVTGESVTGFQNTDFATVKYDPNGNQLWVARYDGGSFEPAKFLALDSSGNVYVSGNSSTDTTGYDFATVKYSSSGSQLWVARHNGPSSDYDDVRGFAVDSSGNAYVMGHATGWNIALIKYDTNGNQLWIKRYSRGSAYGYGDGLVNSMTLDTGGNSYVVGSEQSGASSTSDYITLKFPNAP